MMCRSTFFAMLVCFGVAAFPHSASAQAKKSPPASAPTLQSSTRLITVDVVATDSHGKPVRGLTQNDFQLSEEHAGQQTIAKFRFVDESGKAPLPPPPPSGGHVYSNQAFESLSVPPSILLMDVLN